MPTKSTIETPDDIWKGDLFDRRSEAEQLVAYIESVAKRRQRREDSHGFTIAVDADYGYGKTFFLRRLKKHLALNHAVAFVDAWADDICDDPLVALIATLEAALKPVTAKNKKVEQALESALKQAGDIASLVAKGAVIRGLGFILTDSVASGIAGLLTSEEGRDMARALASKSVGGGVDDARTAGGAVEPLRDRLNAFKNGKSAINDLRSALRELVDSLPDDRPAPIVIIIDELDRCRPTYAIKVLEEIKHLFDVPGIVFILGLNGDQLAASIKSAYGPTFNGEAYLRRFIGRRYRLKQPRLQPLVEVLMSDAKIPTIASTPLPGIRQEQKVSLSECVADTMERYGLVTRDAFQVVDYLQTCEALAEGRQLLLPYLCALIACAIAGREFDPREFEKVDVPKKWLHSFSTVARERGAVQYEPHRLVSEIHRLSLMDESNLRRIVNSEGASGLDHLVYDMRQRNVGTLGDPRRYRQLIESVGRFE